ncbi:MAG: hypothetical protein ACRD1Z_23030, partial [Vicinamibacteria bacterium]
RRRDRTMRKTTQHGLAIACSVLVSVGMAASAQEATELFIPIGQSPDLSNEVTVIGTIESVDAAARTLVVKTDSGSATAATTEKTTIYLDRSRRKESNRYGAFEDLKEGARVEVLYVGRKRAAGGPAEWVKVEVAP